MEGLEGYGSSDSGGEDEIPRAAPLRETPSVRVNAAPDVTEPEQPTPTVCPSVRPVPSGQAGRAGGQQEARWLSAAPQTTVALKRQSASGQHSRQTAPKLARLSACGRPQAQAGVLLPPQLRGRANVVTEDLERMGHKKL